MCIYGWVPLLSTWNYHNIVNQLYANTELKSFKNKRASKKKKKKRASKNGPYQKNSLKKIFKKKYKLLVIISFSCPTRSKQNLVGFIHFPSSFSQSFNPPDKPVHRWGYFPEGRSFCPTAHPPGASSLGCSVGIAEKQTITDHFRLWALGPSSQPLPEFIWSLQVLCCILGVYTLLCF